MTRERGERATEPAPAPPPASLNIAEIRQLISLMRGSDVEEIAIEQESHGLRLVLRKQAPSSAVVELEGEPHEVSEDHREPPRDSHVEVGAPLVGIFRLSMQPGGQPLIRVDDVVREGQVVAAIEALNVYNEVEAPSAGRVREIRVSEGQAVEYGEALVIIEP